MEIVSRKVSAPNVAVFFVLILSGLLMTVNVVYSQPDGQQDENFSRTPSKEDLYSLMPWPQKIAIMQGGLEVKEVLRAYIEGPEDERVRTGIHRFARLEPRVSEIEFVKTASRADLIINFKSKSSIFPTADEEEGYQLKVSERRIELTANTSIGILRGLETLSQLLVLSSDGGLIPLVRIEDEPRFKWRGITIDVSRHWIPKKTLLRNLDAMARAKFNVLHLHISDDQGYRLESKVYPKLHELSSNGQYYTHVDIHEIVSHASDLGIRVLPEIDVPGHATAIVNAYPELANKKNIDGLQATWGIFDETLDPTNEAVYEFLSNLFQEVSGLFPDTHFHFGGDEVPDGAWTNQPHIKKFMDDEGFETQKELQTYFVLRVAEIIRDLDKVPVGWGEVLSPDLPNDIIIQPWSDAEDVEETISSGFKTIRSYGYYLDHLLSAEAHYEHDPVSPPRNWDLSSNSKWRLWGLTIKRDGRNIPGELLLIESNDKYFGRVKVGGRDLYFDDAELQEGKLSITNLPAVPVAHKFKFVIQENSLYGETTFPGIRATITGTLVRDASQVGAKLPSLPSSEAYQDDALLGIEACLWTEWISAETMEMRLWPRTAAIGEKAWSAREDTQDIEAMYLRLESMSAQLTGFGLTHLSYQESLLKGLLGRDDIEPFLEFVWLLEPVKYYFSLKQMRGVSVDNDLTDVVDALHTESNIGRRFNAFAKEFLAAPENESAYADLRDSLESWRGLHSRINEYFGYSQKLSGFAKMSESFSYLAGQGLRAIDHLANLSEQPLECDSGIEESLKIASQPVSAAYLSVIDSLTEIILRGCGLPQTIEIPE